ncbi:MAG: hypothetical protein ACTSX6_02525, partial [Candidatus Heimdallarchaeaceae archaeon]
MFPAFLLGGIVTHIFKNSINDIITKAYTKLTFWWKNMPQRMKIKKFGLGDRAVRLRAEGLSYREVAKKLSNETGRYFSHMSVKNFFESSKSAMAEAMAGNKEIRKKVGKHHLSLFKKQLNKLDKILWKHLDDLESAE